MEKRQRALAVFIAIGFMAITGCALDGTHECEEDNLIPPDTMLKISSDDVAWTEKVYADAGKYMDVKNDLYSKLYFNKDNKLILKKYYVAPAGTEDWKCKTFEEMIYDSAGRVKYYDVFKKADSYDAGEWDTRYAYEYKKGSKISKITKYRNGDTSTVVEYALFSHSILDCNIELHNLESGDRKSTFEMTMTFKKGGEYDTKIKIDAIINSLYGSMGKSVEYFYLDGAPVKEVHTDTSNGGIVRYLYQASNGMFYKYRDSNYNYVIDKDDAQLMRYVNLQRSNYDPFDPMNAFIVFNMTSYLWGTEQRYYSNY